MSYQAYLDAIEKKTGKTPQELLDEAAERGYGPGTKAGVVIGWLKQDYDLTRGYAMALYGCRRTDRWHRSSTSAPADPTATNRPPCAWTASLLAPRRETPALSIAVLAPITQPREDRPMSSHVYRITEIVGTSPTGWTPPRSTAGSRWGSEA